MKEVGETKPLDVRTKVVVPIEAITDLLRREGFTIPEGEPTGVYPSEEIIKSKVPTRFSKVVGRQVLVMLWKQTAKPPEADRPVPVIETTAQGNDYLTATEEQP